MKPIVFFNKIGNCFTFALYDWCRYGGDLCIEFWNKTRVPHFSVQRSENIYDLKIVTFIVKYFWYWGEPRITSVGEYKHFDCRRFLISRRRIKT